MMTECVRAGYDHDYVFELPMPTLNALIESVYRTKYKTQIEMTHAIHAAANGSGKQVKEFLKQWHSVAGTDGGMTGDDLVKRFGSGF